jgi:hypothetical protein
MNEHSGLRFATVFLLATTGCSVFDASLIPKPDAGAAPSTPDAGTVPIEVFASCEAALANAVVLPGNAKRSLQAAPGASCGDNPPSSVSCVVDPLTGNSLPLSGKNFYFAFTAAPIDGGGPENQKWHVHATNGTLPEKVALYVLGSCAANQTCEGDQINAGIKTDSDEHLSFQVSAPGKYIVVVNSTPAQGDACPAHFPTILLQHDQCGDDDPTEHGKSCNDPSSPTCIDCKKVLPAQGGKSAEPNDSPLDANIIPVGDTLFRMESITMGQLGISGATGINPYDFYGLLAQTPPGPDATVTATLNWIEDGMSCSHGYLAAIQVGNQWFMASNSGYAGIMATSPPQAPNDLPCALTVTFPFGGDTGATTGLSSYLIRVAATSKVTYNLTVSLNATGDR